MTPKTEITEAAQTKACIVFINRLKNGITVSNITWGMDVGFRLLCLRFPAQTEALRRADPPSKESFEMKIKITKPGKTGDLGPQ
jgi:hypothetical protein